MLEKAIRSKIIGYLKQLPYCEYVGVLGGAANSGVPDLIVCHKGQTYCFEVKKSASIEPTKQQRFNLMQWAQAGAVCRVVSSLQEVREVLACPRLKA